MPEKFGFPKEKCFCGGQRVPLYRDDNGLCQGVFCIRCGSFVPSDPKFASILHYELNSGNLDENLDMIVNLVSCHKNERFDLIVNKIPKRKGRKNVRS